MKTRRNIFGTDGNDTLWGTRFDDVIGSRQGNDTIFTGAGDDTVYAGSGDDAVHADVGNDRYTGGAGIDTIYFNTFHHDNEHREGRLFRAGVTIDLANRSAQDLGTLGRDRVVGFENIAGSYGNDRLTGTDDANIINGIDGNDKLMGLNGRDELTGGAGRDIFIGGQGFDTIILGGAERDIVRFFDLRDAPCIGLSAGGPVPPYGPGEEVYWFDHARINGDRLDFRAVDADMTKSGNQDFEFIGTDAFRQGQPGEIALYLDRSSERASGAIWQVLVNLDDDTNAEMRVYVMDDEVFEAHSFIL